MVGLRLIQIGVHSMTHFSMPFNVSMFNRAGTGTEFTIFFWCRALFTTLFTKKFINKWRCAFSDMKPFMSTSIHNFKIFNSVIKFIMIYMVNYFFPKKNSSYAILYNESMFRIISFNVTIRMIRTIDKSISFFYNFVLSACVSIYRIITSIRAIFSFSTLRTKFFTTFFTYYRLFTSINSHTFHRTIFRIVLLTKKLFPTCYTRFHKFYLTIKTHTCIRTIFSNGSCSFKLFFAYNTGMLSHITEDIRWVLVNARRLI